MRTYILALTAIIALAASNTSAGTAGTTSAPPAMPLPQPGTWGCHTTQPSPQQPASPAPLLPQYFEETDEIEQLGTWFHGIARAAPDSLYPNDPYYDYYLGYVKSTWIYIQVGVDPADPEKKAMVYFVGMSRDQNLSDSSWRIVYPAETEKYQVKLGVDSHNAVTQFTIKYSDLTQVCNRTGPYASPSPRLTLHFQCTTTRTGSNTPTTEYLSLTQPARYWWQGVATDKPTGGSVIYEYNILSIQGQFISIEVNAETGQYAIAQSTPAQTLLNTQWTVLYPNLENGFAFGDTQYGSAGQQKFLQSFQQYFADGYQRCTNISTVTQ